MHSIQKILIIRFSSIGDIVLASPLIRVLRSSFPASQIDFVVKSEYAELIRFNHHLSSVIELQNSTLQELRELKRTIRQGRYDVILDIHNSLRSRYLRVFGGAKEISIVNKRLFARFMLINFKKSVYRAVTPVAERYLETASKLGISNDRKGLEIFIPDEVLSSVSSMMGKYRLDRYDTVVGIAPSAKHKTKMWPHSHYSRVAMELIKQRRAKVFLFGSDSDTPVCDTIVRETNTDSVAITNLAGKLSLLETAAALDFCDVVLCNDTAIMHLAAARQRNVVAIFGPTVREFGFFPYETNATILEQKNLYCRPCTHIGSRKCPEGHFRCMNDTSPDAALKAVDEMILHRSSVRS